MNTDQDQIVEIREDLWLMHSFVLLRLLCGEMFLE